MALLNLTAASRAAGVNRSTIARAVKAGRLSTTTNDLGERCIDTAELMRTFGPLKADAQAAPRHALGADALVEVLRTQLQQAHEREQQAQQEKAQLLTLLETEQQARRNLETQLLPAPKFAPGRHRPVWWWVAVLVALVFTSWWFRDVLISIPAR